jgi:hypothetical protein
LKQGWAMFTDGRFVGQQLCSVLMLGCRGISINKTVSEMSKKLGKNIYNGPTNALVCIKTLIQMSHTKTFKITPTCFDNQMIIIRELSDPG